MPPATAKASEFGGISTNIKIYPDIQNGKNVGTYSMADYNSKITTNEQIVNYYNEKIKERKDQYFILLDGNDSIQIILPLSKWNGFIEKGAYNKETQMVGFNAKYWETIKGNTLVWESAAQNS